MLGPKLAQMAWRNIWRNRRRTGVTLAGIAFGVMLAVLFTGLADNTYAKMIDLAARVGSGHVTIQHPEYLDTPSLRRTVTDAARYETVAREAKHVVRVTSRISGQAMLATAANSYGAFFVAYDPSVEDSSTLSVLGSIAEGTAFEAAEDRGIVLGAILAENLHTRLGRKVVYTVTDKSGEIVSGLARVVGIIKTGAASADAGLALFPISALRGTLGYAADEATQIAIFLDDQRKGNEVAERLSGEIHDQSVLTWKQTQPDLAAYIEIDSAGLVFFEVIIMVLVGAGIFNTLFVSVMERLREFGILTAVGFSPAQLFRLVMWESLFVSVTGLAAAAAVTVAPYYYLHTAGLDLSDVFAEGTEVSGIVVDPIMYVDIYPEKLLLIAALVVVSTLLAGVYPAWRAGRVNPVETIRLV